MSQISQITDTLKALLKQHKITYKKLAENLSMSEANVKRQFATRSFTLERLEQICEVMSLSLTDLFLMTEQQTQRLSQLTVEQEEELIADPALFLVGACVRDGWSFEDIVSHYRIEEHECIRMLARLDKLQMIQLLPGNKYKILIAQDFRWIPNGPLERFMTREVISNFMADKFEGEDSFRFYLRGSYSQASLDYLQQKLNQLTSQAAELNTQDAKLPLSSRKSTGLLLAMRPWELSLFKTMRR